jgi:hypothetical protein
MGQQVYQTNAAAIMKPPAAAYSTIQIPFQHVPGPSNLLKRNVAQALEESPLDENSGINTVGSTHVAKRVQIDKVRVSGDMRTLYSPNTQVIPL